MARLNGTRLGQKLECERQEGKNLLLYQGYAYSTPPAEPQSVFSLLIEELEAWGVHLVKSLDFSKRRRSVQWGTLDDFNGV